MTKSKDQKNMTRKNTLTKAVSSTLPAMDKTDPLIQKSTWEEVEDIYQTCANGILEILEFTQNTNKVFSQKPEEVKPEVITCVKGLTRDLDELSKVLVRIHKNHENRTGVIESDLDHKISMDILQDYIGFNEHFKSVVLTPISILSTEMIEFQSKIEKQEQSQQITDQQTVEN
jgi:hypothetical protein